MTGHLSPIYPSPEQFLPVPYLQTNMINLYHTPSYIQSSTKNILSTQLRDFSKLSLFLNSRFRKNWEKWFQQPLYYTCKYWGELVHENMNALHWRFYRQSSLGKLKTNIIQKPNSIFKDTFFDCTLLQMSCFPTEKLTWTFSFRFIIYQSFSIDKERIKPSFYENPFASR